MARTTGEMGGLKKVWSEERERKIMENHKARQMCKNEEREHGWELIYMCVHARVEY